MPAKIFITGIGVISALGKDSIENLSSLKLEKSGIESVKILKTNYQDVYPCGEVKLTNNELADLCGISSKLNLPRTALLGIIAANEACKQANCIPGDNLRTGIIAGTTVGGMDKTERFYRNFNETNFILSHSCGSITDELAKVLQIKDFSTTINTACSSSANAIMHGARLIKNGYIDRALVGGFDSLSMFTLNGFRSLYILSEQACMPFDKHRTGLNLGEGAGFLMLESEKSLDKSKNKALCELTAYANTNDANHQTASSENGEGAYRSMKKALDMASLKAKEISYINTHGTGTQNNDFSEAVALSRLYNSSVPDFSSTKAYTGHTLGASGGIEAVFSVLAIQNGIIFPNLNFKNPMDNPNLVPQTKIQTRNNIIHVMSNSFGFGGNDTTLIFSQV